MPILLTPQGRKLYVLRRISTGEIIKRNTEYPNLIEDSPIEGLDPDLEYLVLDKDVPPDYDSRIYSLETNESKDNVANTWRITFDTIKHPNTQIKQNALNIEAFKNQEHISQQELQKVIILGLGILFRKLANQQLTSKEELVKDRIISVASTYWKHDERVATLFTAIENGETPDLDASWEPKP